MSHTADEVTRAVLDEVARCLDECVIRIEHAVQQLSDDQVWWRHDEHMNSIGNLLLHLSGNVRQWIICGIGDVEDRRDRPAEFARRDSIPKADLLAELTRSIQEAKDVIACADAETMLQPRKVQGFDLNGWGVIFDCVPHFKGHTQEIIYITRTLLGDAYQFHWQPTTPEQGAP